jgi:hypothetical protein
MLTRALLLDPFRLTLSADGQTLYVAGANAAGAPAAVALLRSTGKVISSGACSLQCALMRFAAHISCLTGSASSSRALAPPFAVLSSASEPRALLLVAADATAASLGSVDLAKLAKGEAGSVSFKSFVGSADALLQDSPASAGGLRVRAAGQGIAALETASGAALALLHASQGSATPAVLAQWKSGAALSAHVQSDDASVAGLVAAAVLPGKGESGLTLQVIEAASGKVVHTERFPELPSAAHGAPMVAFLGGYTRKTGGRGFRVALTSEDTSFALLQQGLVVWTREEALAEVVDSLALEPVDASAQDADASPASLLAWSTAAVAHIVSDITSGLLALLPSSGSAEAAQAMPAAHTRVFVVLTACGKVLGLSSDRGVVLWSWQPSSEQRAARTLILWRGGHAPLVLLAGLTRDGASTSLIWLDARTGVVAGSATVPMRADRMVPLPALDAEGRHQLMLWEQASGRISLYPEPKGANARAAAAAAAAGVYLHAVDGASGAISGYAVSASADGSLRALPTWAVELHAPVLATAARSADDVVFSHTRVRGDRSTAYKYLSPNTMLVVAAAPADAQQAAGLDVSILDTVTGRFLYRVRHAGAAGPVTAAAADNWFVYAYWSATAQRTEVSVLELLEDSRSSGGVLAAVARALGSRPAEGGDAVASSLAPSTLRVLGQTYTLGTSLSALGVTVTRRGLTSRHLLLGTRAGRLVALDRRFVDPRRPMKPTAADREEGLVPYSEALPFMPGAYLTGSARLARLRGIGSAPAALESASHVLAFGLDVFHARTAPSQTFDTLGAGFSRAMLAATITALAAGAAAAGWAVHRDDLARRWQ